MAQFKLTPDILAAAVLGFEEQKTQIDAKISAIRRLLDGRPTATAPTDTATPRKKRSAAVRRRMKLAQQLRWQKIKEAAEPPQAESAKPKKRHLSAKGRRAIVEATKRRWAKVKAAKKAGSPAVAKKAGRKKPAA
jgi:hypothetical protein